MTTELRADAGLGEPADVAERFGAGGWRFDTAVAEAFDEHVRASVPYYADIQAMIAELCDWLLPPNGLVADLGCATGTSALAILGRHAHRCPRFALYDESAPMLAKARPRVEALAPDRVSSHLGRLESGLEHSAADVTLAVFVLQFLPLGARFDVLADARERAAPGGSLIVAEKLRVPDSRWAEIGADVSHDRKAVAGVSAEAIRAKARALRGVLRPISDAELVGLVQAAGWTAPACLFRWHQWAVFGAFAGGS